MPSCRHENRGAGRCPPVPSSRRKPRSCGPSGAGIYRNEDSGGAWFGCGFGGEPRALSMEIPQVNLSSALWLRYDPALHRVAGKRSFLFQLGCQLGLDKDIGQPVPTKMPTGVFAAGEVLGLRSLPEILRSGQMERNGRRTTYATGKLQLVAGIAAIAVADSPAIQGILNSCGRRTKEEFCLLLRRRSGEGSTTRSGRRFRRN